MMPVAERGPRAQPVVVSIVLLPTGGGGFQIAAVQGADPITLPTLAKVLGEAQRLVLAQIVPAAKE